MLDLGKKDLFKMPVLIKNDTLSCLQLKTASFYYDPAIQTHTPLGERKAGAFRAGFFTI
jgi:hypothetical protein